MAKLAVSDSNRLLDAAWSNNSEVADGRLTQVGDVESFAESDTSKVEDVESTAVSPSVPASRVLKPVSFWIVFMVLTGGSVDSLAKVVTDSVQQAGIGKSAVVFLIVSMSFLSCAVPPTFKKADRASIREVNANNRLFKYKVLAPSLAVLVNTGLRFVAILYASPAVVCMLKNSVQLFSLSLIQHFRGKRLSRRPVVCLVGAFIGQLVVSLVSVFKQEPGVEGPVALGVALACTSGFLGAVQNVFEEALLQGDNLSTGALLMAESWISFLGATIATLAWQGFRGQLVSFLQELGSICARAEAWPILLALMLCTYGKDFGKLFVTKYASALTAKVCCMLFPIVTWILSLIIFASTRGSFGEGLDAVASPIRLAGFSIVAGSCAAFVVLQKRK